MKSTLFILMVILSGCYLSAATEKIGRYYLEIDPDTMRVYRKDNLLYFYNPAKEGDKVFVETSRTLDISRLDVEPNLQMDKIFNTKRSKSSYSPLYPGRPSSEIIERGEQLGVRFLNRELFYKSCANQKSAQNCYFSVLKSNLQAPQDGSIIWLYEAPPYGKGAIIFFSKGVKKGYASVSSPHDLKAEKSTGSGAIGSVLTPFSVIGDIILLPIGLYRYGHAGGGEEIH